MPTRLAACLLPLLCLPLGTGEHLRPRSQAGLRVERTLSSHLSLALEGFSARLDGHEVPPEFLPRLDVQVRREERLAIQDEALEAEGGELSRVRRRYEEIASAWSESGSIDPPGDSWGSSGEGQSPLEGRTVVFVRGEGGAWSASFEGDGDEELLGELAPDLDGSEFLAEGEVEVGEAWEVPAHAALRLLWPLDALHLEEPRDEGEEPWAEVASDAEITARLARVRAGEGGRIAEVEIEGELRRRWKRPATLEDVPVADGTATEEQEDVYLLSGLLAWDLTAGGLRSLEIDAAVRSETRLLKDPGQPGPAFDSTVLLRGSFELELSARER